MRFFSQTPVDTRVTRTDCPRLGLPGVVGILEFNPSQGEVSCDGGKAARRFISHNPPSRDPQEWMWTYTRTPISGCVDFSCMSILCFFLCVGVGVCLPVIHFTLPNLPGPPGVAVDVHPIDTILCCSWVTGRHFCDAHIPTPCDHVAPPWQLWLGSSPTRQLGVSPPAASTLAHGQCSTIPLSYLLRRSAPPPCTSHTQSG